MQGNTRKTFSRAWLKTRHIWTAVFLLLTTFTVLQLSRDVASVYPRNVFLFAFHSKQADMHSRDEIVLGKTKNAPTDDSWSTAVTARNVSKTFEKHLAASSVISPSDTMTTQTVQMSSASVTQNYLAKTPTKLFGTVESVQKTLETSDRPNDSLPEQFANDARSQPKPRQVRRILEVAYFRSGSSFLGQLLSANPRTFYHFEPLRTLSAGVRLSGVAGLRALEYITDFFNCIFENHTDHLRLAMKYPHPFRQNTYLWSACNGVKTVCLDPKFLNSICMAAPVQVMKVVRMGLDYVEHILHDRPPKIAGALSVVHLVRDPRAIWVSRQQRLWCRFKRNCSSAAALCADIERDMDAFDRLSRKFPDRMIQVRYEDVALDPFNTAMKLYDALGLPYTMFVRDFIRTHTWEKDANVRPNPYSTTRNSTDVVHAWRRKIKPLDAERVNKACRRVIQRLGYEL